MAMELSENDLHTLITWWRASNRYDATVHYKSDEMLNLEMKLVSKLFMELYKCNTNLTH